MTHPDAEELARYAEGRLPGPAGVAIEEHCAVCADCRDLLVDASACAAEGHELETAPPAATVLPFRRRKVVIGLAAGIAAAAAIVLATRFPREPSVSAAFDNLITVVNQEPTRTLDGRLAGFHHAPTAAISRGTADADAPPDLRIAAAAVEKAAAGRSDAASLAAAGVAHAVVGELDEAIADLERAAAADSTNAQRHSDLSAVYLARGRRDSRPADYDAAVAAADRALALDPSSPNACFNRALALDALTRRDEARLAWERCLTLERDGAWAGEIQARLSTRP